MDRVRGLLVGGAGGALLFVVVFLVNDRIKPDYDPVSDFVSEAAIGRGWGVQVANFLVCGALIAAAGPALRTVVSRWTGLAVSLTGTGLFLAGIFVSDTRPDGARTWHGITHDSVTLVVFTFLTVACFTAMRWRPSRAWRVSCWAVGLAVPVLFLAAGANPATTGVFQRICLAVGWTWLAALCVRALRLGPDVAVFPTDPNEARAQR